jgi:outer membrane protein W
MKSINIFLAGILGLSLTAALGASTAIADHPPMDNEGLMIVKARVHTAIPQQRQKIHGTLVRTELPKREKKLFANSIGGEISSTFFFDDTFSGEIGLGITGYKLKNLAPINNAYSSSALVVHKNKAKQVYFMPLSAIVQINLPIPGDFRPYVGLGYHYGFMNSSAKLAKFSNTHGPVFQFGFDVWAQDGLGFNFDVKKYIARSTVKYHENVAPVKGKFTFNPWTISAGIGYKF